MTDTNENRDKKTKNPYYDMPKRMYERDVVGELLREARENIPVYRQRCIYCGYEITDYQNAVKVIATDDIIHEECWQNYAEESFEELCTPLACACDRVPEGMYEEE